MSWRLRDPVGRRNGDQRGHWAVASSVPQSGRRHGPPHYHHRGR